MNGTDDPENLIELTIEEHAESHRLLYEKYGKWQDFVAWKALSGQIGKEEILKLVLSNAGKEGAKRAKELGVGYFENDKEKLRYWNSLQSIEAKRRGGRIAGQKNAESGHCQEIAHLGGKSSAGMTFWYNPITNVETRSFISPGKDWIEGVKMERVNIESLRSKSNNTKGTFWIHNPETGESKMIFEKGDIPDDFILGRKISRKNNIELLNVGIGVESNLIHIASDYSDIRFDLSYNRWVFEFKIGKHKNKITHIDYYTLVWARDVLINYFNLDLRKSTINFTESHSKDEVVLMLRNFREFLKIEKIILSKMKKSKSKIYQERMESYRKDFDFLIRVRNRFL